MQKQVSGNKTCQHENNHHKVKTVKYGPRNTMHWNERKAATVSYTHPATENVTASHGLVKTYVRPEELGIVLVVLMLWVAAITLFINRWGKIRLMEPYQPHFEPTAPALPPSTAPPRSSICFADRRPSMMLMQCMDDPQTRERRRSSHWQSCLSMHRADAVHNKVNSIRMNFAHKNFPSPHAPTPERCDSFVNIFQHKNNAFNNGQNKGLRRRSEMNELTHFDSSEHFGQFLLNKKILNMRRTSLQIPTSEQKTVGVQKSPFQSLVSLDDGKQKKTEITAKTKYPRKRRSVPSCSETIGYISTVNESKESINGTIDEELDQVPAILSASMIPDLERRSAFFYSLKRNNKLQDWRGTEQPVIPVFEVTSTLGMHNSKTPKIVQILNRVTKSKLESDV